CFFWVRTPPSSARFPYTTLFRSRLRGQQLEEDGLVGVQAVLGLVEDHAALVVDGLLGALLAVVGGQVVHEHAARAQLLEPRGGEDRKSTRLNSSHVKISYAVFCL